MYLHLGNDIVVKIKDIIGIFDLENTSISKFTRIFLKEQTKKNNVVNITDNIPKSFILTKNNKEEKLFLSQISPATLKLRLKKELETGGF